MVVGVVAAVVYGLVAPVYLLAWRRKTAWSNRYQMLVICTFFPDLGGVLFLMVAYQTKLPTAICLLIALLAGLLLLAFGRMRRRARRQNGV